MKVLIADDIGYSRHNLAMALQRLGHDAIQADSGAAGLSILRKDHTVDAVITDLIMDGIDGVEFFIRAKLQECVDAQGKTAFPPFLLLTCAQPGRSAATTTVLSRLKMASEIGFAKILFKPMNPKLLKEALDGLLLEKSVPSTEIAPLIGHLKDITQRLIRSDNFEDAAKLKQSLQEQLRLLEQVAVPVES